MTATRFTELVGCGLPIQSAPMGGVAGVPDLAAAVSEAGGLGMVGAALVPPPALEQILDEIERRTDAPVGVSFLMPFLDRDAVQVAAPRVRVVDFFYDDPDSGLVDAVHSGGALAAWQVGSVDEARAAEQSGCDFVVAQGVEAGGHVRGTTPLAELVPAVVEAVDVPVVAAGGIATAAAVSRAIDLGADGVRAGTAFIATPEADAHAQYIEALLAARGDDTVLTEAFSVMWPDAPHRVLRSSVEAAEAFGEEVVGEMELAGEKMPLHRFAVPCPSRTATGQIEAMALYAGQGVGDVREVRPAAEVVADLAAGLSR